MAKQLTISIEYIVFVTSYYFTLSPNISEYIEMCYGHFYGSTLLSPFSHTSFEAVWWSQEMAREKNYFLSHLQRQSNIYSPVASGLFCLACMGPTSLSTMKITFALLLWVIFQCYYVPFYRLFRCMDRATRELWYSAQAYRHKTWHQTAEQKKKHQEHSANEKRKKCRQIMLSVTMYVNVARRIANFGTKQFQGKLICWNGAMYPNNGSFAWLIMPIWMEGKSGKLADEKKKCNK